MPVARRCMKCGAQKAYVIASYPLKRGIRTLGITHMVRRRRVECENCGERFTTYEIDERDIANIKAKINAGIKKARLTMTVMNRLKRAVEKGNEDLIRIAGTDRPMDARYIDDNKPRTS